jgi:type I restriction enzyme S subunit
LGARLGGYAISPSFEFVPPGKKSGGPDFGIKHHGQTIWIEAVTPAPKGIPADYLAPPSKGAIVEFKKRPDEERLLRWTSVLEDKRKRLEQYVEKGIVALADCTIIAVNSCRLQDYAPHGLGISQLPFALEAVFPIGPPAVWFTPDGRTNGESGRIPRYTIEKPNGAKIPTDSFLNPRYAGVSAIMGCYKKDMLNGELELTLEYNPLAAARLATGILGANKEYGADDKGDHYILRQL